MNRRVWEWWMNDCRLHHELALGAAAVTAVPMVAYRGWDVTTVWWAVAGTLVTAALWFGGGVIPRRRVDVTDRYAPDGFVGATYGTYAYDRYWLWCGRRWRVRRYTGWKDPRG